MEPASNEFNFNLTKFSKVYVNINNKNHEANTAYIYIHEILARYTMALYVSNGLA